MPISRDSCWSLDILAKPRQWDRPPGRSMTGREACPTLPSLHQQHRGLPEGRLLAGWIDHGYLTIVSARGQLAERQAETERQRFRFRIHAFGDAQRGRFEGLGLAAVEGYKGYQRLRSGSAALVGLQVDIQVGRASCRERV